MGASDHGSVLADFWLGQILFRHSRDSSIMYFERGIKKNDGPFSADCAYYLGSLYLDGVPPMVTADPSPIRDLVKAKKFLALSLDMGIKDRDYPTAKLTQATNAIANNYATGLEAYQAGNHLEAYRIWHNESYSQTNKGAMNGLAFLLLNGLWVKQDLWDAAFWYERVGNAGDPEGYMRSANVFMHIEGGILDRAVKMYEKAAEKGVAGSKERIDATYAEIKQRDQAARARSEQNYRDAVELYRKREAEGHSASVYTPKPQSAPASTYDQAAKDRDQQMYDKINRDADRGLERMDRAWRKY